jgi:hypothetical protein
VEIESVFLMGLVCPLRTTIAPLTSLSVAWLADAGSHRVVEVKSI